MAPNHQTTIEVKRLFHRDKPCLALHFPKDDDLIARARQLGAYWSRTHSCWYVEEQKESLYKIIGIYRDVAWVDASAMYGGKPPAASKSKVQPETTTREEETSPPPIEVPPEYEALLKRRRYSPNTIKAYLSLFRQFIQYFHPTPLSLINEDQLKQYLLHLVDKKNVSYSTQNQVINAIKFYYEKVLGQQKKSYWIDRPKKPKKLPQVLSEGEVKRMLNATENIKHWCIMAIIYSAGLRRGEVINLRKIDVDIDRKQIMVRGGKGQKDRQTLLSTLMIKKLAEYLQQYKPHYWLFEGPRRGQYSGSSVGAIVKQAANTAGISKKVTPHVLRHSFATHMMDGGTDTRVIQKVLGHKSILTTSIYTHVSQKDFHKLKSPLDGLFEDK